MNKQEFLSLLDRYTKGEASEEEIRALLNYYNSFQQDEWNEAELGEESQMGRQLFEKLEKNIRSTGPAPVIAMKKNGWKYAAAACIIILAAAGTFFLINDEKHPAFAQKTATPNQNTIIADNEVVLTLADGRRVSLDHLDDGTIATDGDLIIRKVRNMISYETSGSNSSQPVSNDKNTIYVPRGRQFQVILSDGSKVWLNTSSSLIFPSSFPGNSRQVELTGEGYFEIAKDATKPFRVDAFPDRLKKESTRVEVLGTHFNINAYEEESVTKTTLLEGSVKIIRGSGKETGRSHILKPGEQALVNTHAAQQPIDVSAADTESVTAWRSGLFNFRNENIQSIMRELARWYNVDIVYENNIPVRKFSGKFKRNLALSTVLQILEQSSIHFRIEGKKVIVTA